MHFENSTKKKKRERVEERRRKKFAELSAPRTVGSSAARRATYFVQIKENKGKRVSHVRSKEKGSTKVILYDSIVVGIQKAFIFV